VINIELVKALEKMEKSISKMNSFELATVKKIVKDWDFPYKNSERMADGEKIKDLMKSIYNKVEKRDHALLSPLRKAREKNNVNFMSLIILIVMFLSQIKASR
jgi:hypothetical protein